MPTFLFFKGKVKVDEMTGADEKKLEEKIKKWIGEGDSDVGVKGHVSSWGYYSHLVHNIHRKWLQCFKDSKITNL